MNEQDIIALYRQIDALDAHAFGAAFTPNGVATFGNQPPLVGPEAIERGVLGLFGLLTKMEHHFLGLWEIPEGFVLEATVHYFIRGVETPVPVTGTTILRTQGGALRDVRIYYDLSPVFAAAEGARAQQAEATPHPVTQVEDGARGAFVVDEGGERLAEMTYTRVGETRLIIDHTWVSEPLRGTGTARALILALVGWARTHGLIVIPLCPYARAQFDRDPSIRDVLTPR